MLVSAQFPGGKLPTRDCSGHRAPVGWFQATYGLTSVESRARSSPQKGGLPPFCREKRTPASTRLPPRQRGLVWSSSSQSGSAWNLILRGSVGDAFPRWGFFAEPEKHTRWKSGTFSTKRQRRVRTQLPAPNAVSRANTRSPGLSGGSGLNCRGMPMSAIEPSSPKPSRTWCDAMTSCRARISVAASHLRSPLCNPWRS